MGWGGQEIRVVQESLGMLQRGYQVSLAAPPNSRIYARARDAGIPVIAAEFRKKNPLSYLRMRAEIERGRFDIVNTHSSSDSWVAGIAAKMAACKPKIIRTRHISAPLPTSFSTRFIYEVIPDAVMTTGEEIRANMIQVNGFTADKIFSVPTGIDLERFHPETVAPAFRPPGFAVGMVGVLRSWKGHAYFLEAIPEMLRNIPDACFYIAGDGPQKRHLDEAVQKLPYRDRIIFLGHREDIPNVMAAMDVIVHPSYANEGVPQTLLQALAMGKAVVASDAGAIREIIINEETGLLIEPRRPDAIAKGVARYFQSPELRVRFGRQGRRLVEERHSRAAMLETVEGIYARLVRNAYV